MRLIDFIILAIIVAIVHFGAVSISTPALALVALICLALGRIWQGERLVLVAPKPQ